MYFKLIGHDHSYGVENILQIFYPLERNLELKEAYTDYTYYLESELTETYATARLIKDGEVEGVYTSGINANYLGLSLSEQKIIDRAIKESIYTLMRKHTRKTSPWGLLTGIRPVKLVREIAQSHSPAEVKAFLTDFSLVSEKKADTAIRIFNNQESILRQNRDGDYNLYFGVPFCPTKCAYCSFAAYAINDEKCERYVQALIKEMSIVAEQVKGRGINSVYFGGGTPTSLTPVQLDLVLKNLTTYFDLSNITEFTVEAGRPDTIDRERLSVLKDYPVTRISINPQTTKQATLDLIGRHHTVEDFYRAYELSRQMGFMDINADVILGLTDETPEDVERTMKAMMELSPENLTVHTLAVKRASRLKEELDKHHLAKAQEIERMQEIVEAYVSEVYEPYYLYRNKNTLGNVENIGYAKPGHFSQYNIQMMEDVQDIVAMGCASVSKYITGTKINRVSHPKDVDLYIQRMMAR